MSYPARMPDADHWRGEIKCQAACPVHTDARGYIRAIREGDYELAYLIARGPNPLASVCGRICAAPCERACRRGALDAPVAIRALKRFAAERFGAADAEKIRTLVDRLVAAAARLECAGPEELTAYLPVMKKYGRPRGRGERVAVIGSGPAGLAAAHDLALFGFCPVIFDLEEIPGGMLAVGVPEYRLPRDLLQAEIEVIRALGVGFNLGVTVGEDVTLAELIEEYASVIVAVGAKRSRRLELPGVEADGVYGGVEFLRDVALGRRVDLGRRTVIVGGGNVAFDVSRTALRQLQADVSRSALRQPMTEEVHLCCLESREEMPADEVEVREGTEEGIVLHTRLGPEAILTNSLGRVEAVRFKRALRAFDEAGRFAPLFDESEKTVIPCDSVILAVGQTCDFAFVDPARDGIALTERGTFVLDDDLQTSRRGVFVAGDAALGPGIMIEAIASGKKAARSVYGYLTGECLRFEETVMHFPLPGYRRRARFETLLRRQPPTVDPETRRRSLRLEVEGGYTEAEARLEAERCLDCGVNTIFDRERCILCGGCVDVCPENCLRIVPVGAVALAGVPAGAAPPPQESYAMLKNDERCIRCAACADRCPVGAITMERFTFREVCR